MTELVAMMVLRTTLPFWKSRASKLLSLSTLVLAITVTALPFIGIGAAVDLVPLSWSLLAAIFGVIFTYIIANEVTKYFYYRRHNQLS
jgi:Mg2+-importing ATPase